MTAASPEQALVPQIVCPTWCEEDHATPTPLVDVLHMSRSVGPSMRGYMGRNSVEAILTLNSNANPDGSPTVPVIDIDLAGTNWLGVVRDQNDATQLIADLEEVVTALKTWRPELPETSG